jgi:hypothetical protein
MHKRTPACAGVRRKSSQNNASTFFSSALNSSRI